MAKSESASCVECDGRTTVASQKQQRKDSPFTKSMLQCKQRSKKTEEKNLEKREFINRVLSTFTFTDFEQRAVYNDFF
jgi:hypothetical protein